MLKIGVIILLFLGLGCSSQKNNSERKEDLKTSLVTPKKEIKNGFQQSFFQNGTIKSEGNYILGKKEGLHKEWDKEGFLSLEGYYKNGKANGLMKWYHGKDHLAAYGNMVDEIREGDWKICGFSKDDFCIDAYFENGIRSGLWKIYYNNGILWKEQTFRDDKVVAEKCWDKAGSVINCTALIEE